MATGNLTLTASLTNVPRDSIKNWTKLPWWKEMVSELQNEEAIKLDKKLEKIVEKSLQATEERLENGDYYLDQRTGKIRRIPVKLRDVHTVTKDLIDRRKMLQKVQKDQNIRQIEETVDDRLKKLAMSFAQIALSQNPRVVEHGSVIEGEFDNIPEDIRESLEGEEDAVYVEREKGLQEGTGLGKEAEAQ